MGERMKMLTFEPIPIEASRKTKIWIVNCGDHELGKVSWYAAWRRYCFYPWQSKVFDAACLREAADFCEQMTKEHKS